MSYAVYGETAGTYFPWVSKTWARNVSEDRVEETKQAARDAGWQNVFASVEAF